MKNAILPLMDPEKIIIARDAHGHEYQERVADLQQRIAVYALIIEDEKILLAQHWGGYSMIGGGVEKGESLEDAFVREFKEETGLDATPGKIIHHATTYFKRDPQLPAWQSHQFYFTHASICGMPSGVSLTESEKLYTQGDAVWIDLEDAPDLDFKHSVPLVEILENYYRQNQA